MAQFVCAVLPPAPPHALCVGQGLALLAPEGLPDHVHVEVPDPQVGLDVYRASRSEQGLIAEVAEELQEAAAAERSAKLEEQAISGFEDAIKQRQQVA